MTQESILGSSKLVAFVPTIDPAKARAFYEGVLGLRLVEDAKPFALVFDSNGTMLRAGVEMLRFPGMNDTEPRGIWTAPSGAKVAWFKDPDGNALSVTEF